MRLSRHQRAMLESAALLDKRSPDEARWFIPSLREDADVYGTAGTAKSLCARGLLRYKVYMEAVGKYPAVLEFKITEDGRCALHECYTIIVRK